MDSQLNQWIQGIDKKALDLWREAMTQLRQLHSDVWNGVRFFLTVNGILIAGMSALAKTGDGTTATATLIITLAALGVLITLVARSILEKHRRYYLQMLVRKTFIEKELGFWDFTINGQTLAFPWRVDAEHHECLKKDVCSWMDSQRWRPGTISRLLFHVYNGVIGLHLIVVIITVTVLAMSADRRTNMPSNGWIVAGGAIAWLLWVAVFTWGTTRASASDSAIFKTFFGKPGLQLITAPLLIIALVIVFLLKLITAEAFLGLFGTAVGFIFCRATSKSE